MWEYSMKTNKIKSEMILFDVLIHDTAHTALNIIFIVDY